MTSRLPRPRLARFGKFFVPAQVGEEGMQMLRRKLPGRDTHANAQTFDRGRVQPLFHTGFRHDTDRFAEIERFADQLIAGGTDDGGRKQIFEARKLLRGRNVSGPSCPRWSLP